eukprot:TRINITY_DN4310_c0_g1_i1.p1 TRINITY_DN4310_c0_g1~~TRINITY_DN4310_c0_g1_i1.p1  ORF type:complete len:462 (-),score=107.92 TRINITY_DN4310_c0_g1_i1:60-1445(-)
MREVLVLWLLPVVLSVTPVILIPGFLGSALQAQLNRSTVVAPQCVLQSPTFTIWVNESQFTADQTPCLVDNLKLDIDPTTLQFSSKAGVTMQPFSGKTPTAAVERFDPTDNGTNYMEALIEFFEARGYVRGLNVIEAPYEWRFAPFMNSSDQYFSNLKTLFESTAANQSSKVCLLTHSMGSLMALKFFNLQTSDWKAKYVACWISAAGAFGGGMPITKSMVSGENFGIAPLNATAFREAQRTFESSIVLLPAPDVFGNSSIMVQTSTTNYTYSQVAQLLTDLGLPSQASVYTNFLTAKQSLIGPGVPMHCFRGSNISTALQYGYFNGFDQDPQVLTSGDGDGLFNSESLRLCQNYQNLNQATTPQINMILANVGHKDLVANQDFLMQVFSILQNANSPAGTPVVPQKLAPGVIAVIAIASVLVFGGLVVFLRRRYQDSGTKQSGEPVLLEKSSQTGYKTAP